MRNPRGADPERTGLPLTPRATAGRRGSGIWRGLRHERRSGRDIAPAATPSIHVTPNVVVARRGALEPKALRRPGD